MNVYLGEIFSDRYDLLFYCDDSAVLYPRTNPYVYRPELRFPSIRWITGLKNLQGGKKLIRNNIIYPFPLEKLDLR